MAKQKMVKYGVNSDAFYRANYGRNRFGRTSYFGIGSPFLSQGLRNLNYMRSRVFPSSTGRRNRNRAFLRTSRRPRTNRPLARHMVVRPTGQIVANPLYNSLATRLPARRAAVTQIQQAIANNPRVRQNFLNMMLNPINTGRRLRQARLPAPPVQLALPAPPVRQMLPRP